MYEKQIQVPAHGRPGASETRVGRDGGSLRATARTRTATRGLIAALLAAAGLLLVSPSALAAYPVIYNFPAGLAESVVYPTPPGANIWSCKPGGTHPRPVVLVPGLSGSMARDWQAAAPLLANHGYCVFAYDFSSQGQEAIEPAAAGLASFVQQVLTATGATKVDLVSHSEGGVIARYYLQFDGGGAYVHDLAQISPLNHGTTAYGLATLTQQNSTTQGALSSVCAPCEEQSAGSPFMQKLNGSGETVPGVSYTVIATRYDEIITPYQSQFLTGKAVDNILLQDQCSLDLVDHLASQYDSIALQDVLNALDPAQAVPPTCHPVLPGIGG